MAKKFDTSTVDAMDAVQRLVRLRDRSIRHYEAIVRELGKHQTDAEQCQAEIDKLVDDMATVAKGHVRDKHSRDFPWQPK